ncbi:MAG TPA: N-acetyltransferase [Euryarchaeota archaeon]|nr:N-acetyltransferase [Euryarchaeota archaeon]
MNVIEKGGDFEFVKLDSASDVDSFKIPEGKEASVLGSGFGYFKGMGIVNYTSSFKSWLRQFPRPLFVVATKGRELIGWVYIEEWSSHSRTGDPVYVLRAIEVIPKYRRNKVASRLLVLGIKMTVGYLLTKPLNSGAEAFFRMNGFKKPEEISSTAVDLSSHHGYMVLSPYEKQDVIDRYEGHFV